MGEIQWDRAACRDLPKRDEIFFPNPGRPKKVPQYKAICDSCEIRYSCLSFAIVHDEEGVWGGMTKTERDSLGNQVKDQLTLEAKQAGWFEERLDLDSILDQQRKNRRVPVEEVPDLDLFDLPSPEYFDLPENVEPLSELLHEPEPLQQLAAPLPYSDKNHSLGPIGFQFPPSPFSDIDQNSTLPNCTGSKTLHCTESNTYEALFDYSFEDVATHPQPVG